MKTTWLFQLTKGMCVKAQVLAPVSSAQVATVASSFKRATQPLPATTISKLSNILIKHTLTSRTNTNNKQVATNNFKNYNKPVNRIRRPALQVAGAN